MQAEELFPPPENNKWEKPELMDGPGGTNLYLPLPPSPPLASLSTEPDPQDRQGWDKWTGLLDEKLQTLHDGLTNSQLSNTAKTKNEIVEPKSPTTPPPNLPWSLLQLQRLRTGMKAILLPQTLLIPRTSLLSDHLKPEGENVLITLDNAETPEHINEEPVHFHQTAVAAPEVLTPDNSDADLDSPFDPRPVDPEEKPDLDPPRSS
ncbi:hypothetical protein AAES_91692 [Amazona aestiva]|uniref:Uncharacterized protein n=1 Tax=Amazona aestiva TaxID=12930 RepID=A0A0Q3ME09_AMAAE|nr:hypothetical protein AAES_91692 [Amazona aestiva]